MRLRLQTTLALLVILAAVPWSGCGRERDATFRRDPSASVPVIPDGFGVNIHFTDPQPGEMKMLAESGVRWVRMDFKWDLTESAKGTYDFAPYDRLMSALAPFGLRALFILDYGNPLYDDGGPPRTEAARQAFARWAVAAARHFAGRGVIWETWNEPNNQMFWRPRPNVNEYAALALAVARAFRAAVPDEKLVGPAVSEMDFAFLEGCFKAGLLEYWPAVSVHPYLRSNPELVSGDYEHLRELIKTYAPKGKKIAIFSGEWGYSSVWPGMSEEKQGLFLARQWLTNVANDIPLSIWYDWRDDGSDPNEPEHHFGMVSNAYHKGREHVYDPKPAYLAAKTLTTFFGGYQYEKRLNVGGPDDYVLLFRKGTSLRVAAWTSANREHRLIVPLNAGQYLTVTHTGGNASSVTANQNGVLLTLTAAPVYLRYE
ncbi:MAG: cellulase family glycosylhydrolase [Pyrinomonadaceae bacterium]